MTFNKKTVQVLVLMLVLFCGMVLYFSYFQIFKSPALAGAGHNPRTYAIENQIRRGTIYDRNGTALAESKMENGVQTRNYPFGPLYSQLIGYSHSRYGRFLLEDTYNQHLLGTTLESNLLGTLLGTSPTKGADLTLTIDHNLQTLAGNLLGNYKGSIVALDPQSGEVLCMVSKPWFSPNSLDTEYESLSNTPGIFFPRATNWNYVPGSVFKIITAASAVENGLEGYEYEDTGTYLIDGHEIHNYHEKVYGTLDIDTAFAKSSNTYFASLSTELGADALSKTASAFGFGKTIPFDIPLRKSTTLSTHKSETLTSAVGYGQGDTETTPLHMALVCAAIANDGVMMEPYVVKSANANGHTLYKKESKIFSRAVSASAAQRVGSMMEKCVESGTGTGARISGIRVAGKTGTAEVGEGADHAWFVAYAPAENPEIALAIVLENAGTTGSACAPMAQRLIAAHLRK